MAIGRMAFRDYPGGPSFWPDCERLGVAAITYAAVVDVDFARFATKRPTPGWAASSTPSRKDLPKTVC